MYDDIVVWTLTIKFPETNKAFSKDDFFFDIPTIVHHR